MNKPTHRVRRWVITGNIKMVSDEIGISYNPDLVDIFWNFFKKQSTP